MAAAEIDHGLYSRQYYVYGKEAMQKMATSTVLISGLGGVGVEIAKNVALAGVRELVLHDQAVVTTADLSTQFYVTEKNLGKNRAVASAEKVKELNPYTNVTANTSDLLANLDYLKKFSVVCVCNQPLSVQIRLGEFCHQNAIPFVSTESRGLFINLFVDVGENFSVYDKDGEELKEIIVGNITRGPTTKIQCLPNHLHALEKGDWVMFREVQGPDALNGGHYYVVEDASKPNEFVINFDSSSLPEYVEGTGVVQQVKEVVRVSHKPITRALDEPELLFSDLGKLDAPPQLHLGWRAVNRFYDEKGRWPTPWNADDAEAVLSFADAINSQSPAKLESFDKDLLRLMSYVWQGELASIDTFVGGIAGQEVLKSVSGKFMPLRQYLYLDFKEIAPKAPAKLTSGSRYDTQNICIGAEATERLQNLKLFVVGSGAIGCELLKTLAMMGCCTGKDGELTLTDDDHIERSNLNRQFLFRDTHIGQPKSTTAKESVLAMNPDMRIDAHKRRVDAKTEDVYSNAYFESRDCVLNALDNVEARRYVDHRITVCQRPLIESGTMGTKGHVQVIVPFLTETYSQQNDPASKDVPFCTVKSFPYEINHCVQWARALAFQNNFVDKAKLFRQLTETPNLLEVLHSPKVRQLKPWVLAKLIDHRPTGFQDCVNYARHKWEKYFNHSPRNLLNAFPPNHTVDGGKLFWSNPKRLPHPLEFDVNDRLHFQFIVAFANLWAFVWDVPQERNDGAIRKMVDNAPVPKFIAKKKEVETDESVSAEKAEESKQDKVSDEAIASYVAKLEGLARANFPFKLNAVEFEKDDDTNFHIACIDAIANLRARVYRIPEIDQFETKKIAGRIIPAIAATTAVVSGLAGVELIKIVYKAKLEAYKNTFFNLALPIFTLSEPGEVKKERITKKLSTTIWDRWDVKQGDMKLSEFIDVVSERWNIEAAAIFNGSNLVWNGLQPKHKSKLPQKMSDLIKDGKNLEYVDLLVVVEDEEEEEEENQQEEEGGGPIIRFYFK